MSDPRQDFQECPICGSKERAVLENNLTEAVGRADSENLRLLHVYVAYFYNEAPSNCWGSPRKVALWLGERADD